MPHICENLQKINAIIQKCALSCGRDPEHIRLVAVSKTKPIQLIEDAFSSGQRIFGENRIQEARGKVPKLSENASWHMIGHLQKNKAKYAPGLFSMIHSVDSYELALSLDKAVKKYRNSNPSTPAMDILIQVNISKESTKTGAAEEETIDLIKKISLLNDLKIKGLMTIPPFTPDPEDSRVYFRSLRRLKDQVAQLNINNVEMKELSMGMSGDFTIAIEEGATLIRIGSAIFGERERA